MLHSSVIHVSKFMDCLLFWDLRCCPVAEEGAFTDHHGYGVFTIGIIFLTNLALNRPSEDVAQ